MGAHSHHHPAIFVNRFGCVLSILKAILSYITANPNRGSNAINSFPARGVRLMLEVIDKGSCSESHPAPLLFVHGAWHAAWCWDEHFLDFFADKGYRALAVSLRGHGSSPTPKPLRSCSVADYVADVASVADSFAHETCGNRALHGRWCRAEVFGVARSARRRSSGVCSPARNPWAMLRFA